MRWPWQQQQSQRRSSPRGGAYSGRLAFDPDSGFHLAENGRRVVTEDEGKTWRYARRGEQSHFTRYHKRYAAVDSTANAEKPEQHHWGVRADDPHVDGLIEDPDSVAPTVTSHTEAYRDA